MIAVNKYACEGLKYMCFKTLIEKITSENMETGLRVPFTPKLNFYQLIYIAYLKFFIKIISEKSYKKVG